MCKNDPNANAESYLFPRLATLRQRLFAPSPTDTRATSLTKQRLKPPKTGPSAIAPRFSPTSLPDLSGRVYLVTGGNAGIGYYTVFHLAKHNAKVYLASRNASKGTQAIAEIKATVSNSAIELLQMDRMDLDSVVGAAKKILAQETHLHGLINSAGIMATPFEVTRDGYEAQFQTNYISHWLLTYHLLPLLQKTAQTSSPGAVRIVDVTSMSHAAAPRGGINFPDPNLKDGLTFRRYGQSKLASILHIKALEKRYGPSSGGQIWTAAVHPGVVDTGLHVRMMGSSLVPIVRFFGVFIKPEDGAYTSLFAAASDEMKKEDSGSYYVPFGKKAVPSKYATDADLAGRLWEWTEEEMREKGFIK